MKILSPLAVLTILCAPALASTLAITTASCPAGAVGTSYSCQLAASGGTSPYTWSVISGTLSTPLALGASSGLISGTPTSAAYPLITVQATDSLANTAQKQFYIDICPSGYIQLQDSAYLDTRGVGTDLPVDICYRYPSSGTDYSHIDSFFQTSGTALGCVSPQNGGTRTNDAQLNFIACESSATTQHYITTYALPTNQMLFDYEACVGPTCTQQSYNTGSGGWSANPTGDSNYPAYVVTPSGVLPGPPAGTLQWSMTVNGSPVMFQNHTWWGGIEGYWGAGTAPTQSAIELEVDGTPCAAALAGTTCSGIKLQVQCSYVVPLNSSTGDWTTSVWSTAPWNTGYYYRCNNPPFLVNSVGAAQQAPQQIIAVPTTATGSHTITAVVHALDASANDLGANTATWSFSVNPIVPITYTAPSTYPAIPSNPGLQNWVCEIAGGTAGHSCYSTFSASGYVDVANNLLSAETATPGSYFNDSSSATTWTYFMGMYDGGRFATQFGDMLGSCGSGGVLSCPSWSAGVKTLGQIINNGSCFLDVIGPGSDTGQPACPSAQGQSVTNGTVIYKSLGTQQWWYQFAQNMGDQVRAAQLLFPEGLAVQEWANFTDWYAERYSRATGGGNTDTFSKNAISFELAPFITTPGQSGIGPIGSSFGVPFATERQQPLTLNALLNDWVVSGTEPVDSAGVHWVPRYVDLMLNYIYQLTSCTPSGNIVNGWPNCAPNTYLTSPNFDMGLVLPALEYACDVEQQKGTDGRGGTGCDLAIPPAIQKLADWMYEYEYAPNVTAFGAHGEPYGAATIPAGNSTSTTLLNAMQMGSYAWLGAYTGNAAMPLSGATPWSVADDMFAYTFQGGLIYTPLAKQYGQAYRDFSAYLHYRTNPTSGGWTAWQYETEPSLNPYQSNWPNLLGPFAQMTFPQTAYPAVSGTVNTSGTAVTWVSGLQFSPTWQGHVININGSGYTVGSVNSNLTSMTLTGSAGTYSGVNYSMPMPGCTATGAGSAACYWWSAPTSSTYIRWAVAPTDPWSGTQSPAGPAGNCSYYPNSNICLNTASLTGMSAGTYNIAFGGTDSVGNTAQAEVNYSGGYWQAVVPTGPASSPMQVNGLKINGVKVN